MPAIGPPSIALVWGEEGLRDLCRLHVLLGKAGISSEVEFGLSDEGEPWCVFCRRRSDRILAHFALIDGGFIGDWPGLRGIVRSNQLGDVIEQFVRMTVLGFVASTTTAGRSENQRFQ